VEGKRGRERERERETWNFALQLISSEFSSDRDVISKLLTGFEV